MLYQNPLQLCVAIQLHKHTGLQAHRIQSLDIWQPYVMVKNSVEGLSSACARASLCSLPHTDERLLSKAVAMRKSECDSDYCLQEELALCFVQNANATARTCKNFQLAKDNTK